MGQWILSAVLVAAIGDAIPQPHMALTKEFKNDCGGCAATSL